MDVDRTYRTVVRSPNCMAKSTQRPPWKKPNPQARTKKSSRKLTAAQKAEAKSRATRAGRRYPNLVDNMRVAAESKPRKRKVRD
jgi:hypothetical protein